MNIYNLQSKLVNHKWAMDRRSLYSLWDTIQNINTMRVGGVKGFLLGNPPLLSSTAPTAEDSDMGEGDIAIVSVSGIISKNPSLEEQEFLGMCDIDDISDALDEAANDPTVKCILMHFASPGGETIGVEELGRKIKNIDENIKPVYGFTSQNSCSASYWLMSQCRVIGMTHSAQVGSVGVYMIVVNASERYKNEGVEIQAISSGDKKMMGHDYRPLTPEEKTFLTEDVVKQHEKFKDTIKSSRSDVKDESLEGLSYEGADALENGMVDVVCDNMEEFIQYLNQ